MRGQTGSDGEMRNPGSARTCAHSRLLSLPFFGRRLISLFVDSNHVLIQTPCVPHHPTSLASSPTIANIRHYLTPIRIVPALHLYRISLSASPALRLTILHHLTLHYTFPHQGTQRHHIQNHCMPQIYPLAIHPMPCINPGHRASSHTTPHRPKPPALRHIIPHQFTLLYTVPHRTLLFYVILFFHPLIFIFIMLSLLHSLSPSLFHALIPILSSRVILHHLLLPALVLIPLVLSFPFIHQVSFWVIVLLNR